MQRKDLKKGDSILLISKQARLVSGKYEKLSANINTVGRKWITVQGYGQYSITSGYGRDFNSYVLHTEETLAEATEREALELRLSYNTYWRMLPIDKLRRIQAILDEKAEP